MKHDTHNSERLKGNSNGEQLFGDSSDVFGGDSNKVLKERHHGDEHKPTNQSAVMQMVEEFEKSENEKLEKRIESKIEEVLKTVKKNTPTNTTYSINHHQNTPKPALKSIPQISDERRDFDELKNVIGNLTKGIERMREENRKITTTITTTKQPWIRPTKTPATRSATPPTTTATTTTTMLPGK